MRRMLTLLAACGFAAGVYAGFPGTIPGPPVAGATGMPAPPGSWSVLGAAQPLPPLSRPAGLAVEGRKNVYVADTGNHRIVEYASDGRPLAHFGDRDLVPQGPSSLAVTSGGTLYAADAYHRAILVYSPQHRLIARWTAGVPGPQGGPLAVAVSRRGTVIVAAAPESRCTIPYGPSTCATSYVVQRRDASGRVIAQFRTAVAPLGAPGGIITELAVASDGAGDIDVVVGGREPCYKDCRVFHLLVEHWSGGRVVGHWGGDELAPTVNWTAVAIGGRGNIFLADDLGGQIEKRQPGGRVIGRWSIRGIAPAAEECTSEAIAVWQDAVCPGPEGVAVSPDGFVYVSDPGTGRVLILGSGGEYLWQWSAGGTQQGRFWFPASVALDAQGRLWVDDMGNGRVQTVGSDGRYHYAFQVPHAGTGMTLDQQGNIYIGQQLGQQVLQGVVLSKFSPTGNLLARWSIPGMVDPPSGIAIAPNGDIILVAVFLYPSSQPSQLKLNGANILRLSPDGTQLGLIHLGYFGPGPGIAVDAQGNITIAYGSSPHVERYSSDGKLLSWWGAPKPVLTVWGFPSPAFIALDGAGHLYMADTLQNVVKEYGMRGTLLHIWGRAGSYVGQFHHPGGIAVASDGTLYVSDTENHRVQRLVR